MKKHLIFIAMGTLMGVGSLCANEPAPLYKDANAPVELRIEDLLGRMTLEEKVGQMNQYVGLEHVEANSIGMTEEELLKNTATGFYPGMTTKDMERLTEEGLIGSYLHVLTIEEANYIQSLAMKSRLQIPIIFGIDAIHGNANCPDNTVYPTNIGLSCSFDTAMTYKIARQTAREMRSMNLHWTFNPNIEVARDARWGRVGETYGEDPYLVGQLGVASVKGYQGNLSDPENDVLACIKHFAVGSEAVNGQNAAPTDLSERTLREVHFPPYILGVEAGAMSLMTAHHELNGVPCHSNEWLMEDLLRKEWGFRGFVVSDWMDIERIHDMHATAESYKEAYYQSIMAGMDMHMHGQRWQEAVVELVNEGRIPEERINKSVRRILETKFRLGLFEHPFADESKTMEVRLCDEHRATALESARNSIVLLKNEGILPLDASKYKDVLVTGINANDQNMMGDWTNPQKDENVITILEGLRMVSPETDFTFVDQGWDPRNMNSKAVDKAVKAGKKADLNIVVAGEYMWRSRWNDRTCGENIDRASLDLVGLQNELIERLYATGTPTILVLVTGRQLTTVWADEHLPAVLNAWEPGMSGGQAVAEILYGKVNPSAKLSVTVPRSVGQLLQVYNHKPSHYFHPNKDIDPSPLYEFGYGLSYTTYGYSDFELSESEIAADGSVKASVTITNTGDMDGVEIVQMYIRDKYSSVTRPVKEMKDFARVELKAGESKRVEFTITPDKLEFYNLRMEKVVEPGEFIVMVGGSSRDEDLLTKSFVVR